MAKKGIECHEMIEMKKERARIERAPEEDLARARQVAEILRLIRRDFQESFLEIISRSAIFKAKVGGQGRITIPEAEREALGIEPGDIVQVIVIPLKEVSKNLRRDSEVSI